ncbi:MAG: 4-hydroxybenzoate octaprenyltransferase [Pseudomonadota bacterium]|jgi:4-hydroxybenzoate polyprenyltransferase
MIPDALAPDASSILPDAAADNWVDRYAPAALRPWLKLGRFDRPAGIWLLMLPGWQGIALADASAGRAPNFWHLLLFAIGAAAMRAAGCAYNDIVDRDIDAKVARTAGRPVASGAIGVRQAWLYVAGLCLVGLLVLVQLPLPAIVLGGLSLALVAAYPFMKRITWWPQAWLGLTFNWGALMGYAAGHGGLALPGVLLYASGFFWTLGYDTLYAVQDLEDDALAGVKSSARRLGSKVRLGVGVFYAASAVLALAAGVVADLSNLFLVLVLAFAAHLALQVKAFKPGDGALALKLFRSNRDAGLYLFAALALGAWQG